MDAITKFKEAAVEFQKSDLYKNLEIARKANDGDTALQDEIGEFNLVRLELNNEMNKDEKDEERIAQLNQRVSSIYDSVMGNPHMVAYSEAKEEIEKFMNYINAILNAAISGEDPMQVEEPSLACGEEGCSSCAGCN